MKILNIKFKNINSLEGEHEIDFEDKIFRNNSIFAIIGPTGSGKSSILDMITLALYSQMPRMNSVSKEEIDKSGAVITYGRKESYARVKYRCGVGVFTSEWSIRITRGGKLDNVKMCLYDEGGEILEEKIKAVIGANQKNIGLSYEQFTKSVMLVQGEFARFLKVDKKERSELLEKITGTSIYRELGRMAFEKNKEFVQKLKELEGQKDFYSKYILEADFLKEIMDEVSKLEKNIDIFRQEKDKLVEIAKFKDELKEKEDKLKEIKSKLHIKEEEFREFDEREGVKLQNHLKTDSFANELVDWKGARASLREKNGEIERMEKEIEALEKSKKEVYEEVCKLIGKSYDYENLEEGVNIFLKELNELNGELSVIRSSCSLVQRELKEDWGELGRNFEKDIEQNWHFLKEEKDKNLAKMDEVKGNIGEGDLENLEDEIKKGTEKVRLYQKGKEISKEISYYKDNLGKKETQKGEKELLIKDFPREIEVIKKEIGMLKGNLELLGKRKEMEDSIKGLEKYRNELEEGKECPLCGSVHHPKALGFVVDVDKTQKEMKEVDEKIKMRERELTNKEVTLNKTREDIEEIKKDMLLIAKEIEKRENDFKKDFGGFEVNEDWEGLIAKEDARVEEIRIYINASQRLAKIVTVEPKLQRFEELCNEGIELKKRVDEKIGGAKDVEKSLEKGKRQWTQTIAEIGKTQDFLKQSKGQAEKLKKDVDKMEILLDEKVKVAGFGNIKEAMESRMEGSEYARLNDKKVRFEKEVAGMKGELISYENICNEMREKDSQESVQEVKDKVAEKTFKIKEMEIDVEGKRHKLTTHNENMGMYEKVNNKIEEVEREGKLWELLAKLIGDAKGDKFNQYAQDLTLRQLVLLANKRLLTLSGRYLIDVPNAGEQEDSLVVVDKDMGGKRRSVKTLSGGESFLVSLSLSLALSDLASNNVKINSLFIDEGFGTLDSDTLDQTISTLEKLQEEGEKTIGVISHVEALKERISAQIRISQKGGGLSEIEVGEFGALGKI